MASVNLPPSLSFRHNSRSGQQSGCRYRAYGCAEIRKAGFRHHGTPAVSAGEMKLARFQDAVIARAWRAPNPTGRVNQAAGASPKNSTAHPQLRQRIGRSSPRASHCCGEHSRCCVSSCRGHFGLWQIYWYAMIEPQRRSPLKIISFRHKLTRKKRNMPWFVPCSRTLCWLSESDASGPFPE